MTPLSVPHCLQRNIGLVQQPTEANADMKSTIIQPRLNTRAMLRGIWATYESRSSHSLQSR